MTWELLLAVLALACLVSHLARRQREFFALSRAAPISMRVEGSRRLRKKTRVALESATAVLRRPLRRPAQLDSVYSAHALAPARRQGLGDSTRITRRRREKGPRMSRGLRKHLDLLVTPG